MRAKLLTGAAVTALSAAATVHAQPTNDLLFTTLKSEGTNAALTPSLHEIGTEDVMAWTPQQLGAISTAEKFAPFDAWKCAVGDHDADGKYDAGELFGKIDAATMRANRTNSMVDLYISPSRDTTSVVSATLPTVFAGDVIRVAPGGQFELFLSEDRVRAAYGIAERINIDAVDYQNQSKPGQDPPIGLVGMVYFSLEEDHVMTVGCGGAVVTRLVRDGAILAVQVDGFDTDGAILGGQFLVATEADVSAMVAASGIADNMGNKPTAIIDTDGLAFDQLPGAVTWQGQCGSFPSLLFTGEALTGGGVLWTRGGGTIAQVNGYPLGSTVQSNGELVGLEPDAGSLNALELSRVCRLVTDTPTSTTLGGGINTIDVGGVDPGASVWLLLSPSIGLSPIGGVANTISYANPCYPELIFPFLPVFIPLAPGAADGTTTYSWSVPLLPGPGDLCFVWQALSFVNGAPALSTPETTTLEF